MILYFSHSAFTKFCTMIFKWMIKHYQNSFKWTLTHRIDYISTFTVVCKTECASFMVYIFRDHVEKLGNIHNASFNYFKNLYFSLIRANACSLILERELDKNICHACLKLRKIQHYGCWWPGTCSVPGHLQPLWWHRLMSASQKCPQNDDKRSSVTVHIFVDILLWHALTRQGQVPHICMVN